MEQFIGCILEQRFLNDHEEIFEIALGVKGLLYRVDFSQMSQTNVPGGFRQCRLHRGDPTLDLEMYSGWASLKEIYSTTHLNLTDVSCLIT